MRNDMSKELIDRIMSEAEQIIRGRLAGLLDDTASPRPAIPTMMTGSSARAV